MKNRNRQSRGLTRRLLVASACLMAAGCTETTESPFEGPAMFAKGGAGGGGPRVDAIDPPNVPQGVTLNMTITGSGFTAESKASFELAGSETEMVSATSTTFLSDTELSASVTVAAEALAVSYDVAVKNGNGPKKKGVGIELLKVDESDPELPDPEITFSENGALWVMNADGANVNQAITGAATNVWHPSWAPTRDGEPLRIIFESDGTLYTVDLSTVGGTLSSSPPEPVILPPGAQEPDWGPAGEILYTTTVLMPDGLLHSAIHVISETDLPNPTPTEVYVAAVGRTEANSHNVGPVAWSPSGDAIAFVENDEFAPYQNQHALRVIDRASGAVSTVVDYGEFPGAFWGMDWSATVSVNALAFAFSIPAPRGNRNTMEIQSLRLMANGDGTFSRYGESFSPITGFAFPTWSPDDSGLLVSDLKSLKTINTATGSTASLTVRAGRSSDWRR